MQGRTGFTLTELLIVLATVAVLAAIAYPSYASYTIKARRTEGQIALIEALQQQERFYTSRNTYVAFSSASAEPQAQRFKWWSGSSAATSAYELRAQACPGKDLAQCVELRATPGSARVDAAFKDAECETLILNSVGERSASGARVRCWP